MIGEILVGRFRLEERLGGGAQGEIYRARDLELSRWVAIKIPNERVNEDFVNTFKREAKLLVKFEHDNVVTLHDYYEPEDGMPFLVMEYLKGEPLDLRLLNLENPLSREQLCQFVDQICGALYKAHNVGLIHRDIKPSNVMLVDEGKADEKFVILDLGIAKLADFVTVTEPAEIDTSGEFYGTIAYMSPEQLEGNKVDHRCDIYSFGTTLYQVFTGRLPFEPPDTYGGLFGFMQKVVKDQPPSMSEISIEQTFPDELEELVQYCMAKKADERPESMREVADLFRVVYPSGPTGGYEDTEILSQETIQSLEFDISRKLRARHFAWTAALILLVGGLWWMFAPGPKLAWEITPNPETFQVVAGDTSQFDITIFSNLDSDAQIHLPGFPGVSWNDEKVGAELVLTSPVTPDKPGLFQITATAATNAQPSKGEVEITNVNGELIKTVAFDIHPPNVWHPQGEGFRIDPKTKLWPHPGETFATTGKKLYLPERITREITQDSGEKIEIPFLLIDRDRLPGSELTTSNWPAQSAPFYLTIDKVSNRLVSAYLAEGHEEVKREEWIYQAASQHPGADQRNYFWQADPESYPDQPAMNLTVEEANAIAKWIGGGRGRLPKTTEWDIASGLYDRNVSFVPEGWPEGPYRGVWNSTSPLRISLNKLEGTGPPAPVGPAAGDDTADDESPYGCRDMAGNGFEFTGDVYRQFGGISVDTVPLKQELRESQNDLIVYFRGQCYFRKSAPLKYRDLEDVENMDDSEYPLRRDDAGFRVLLPIEKFH